MKILLIEDEEHKANELVAAIVRNGVNRNEVTILRSVKDAVLGVATQDFDLIVLDMALPTFSADLTSAGGGGEPQAVGGIEILRSLHSVGRRSNVVIVTQYPEITVGGNRVKIQNIGKFVSDRYKQRVIGAVLYSYKSVEWEGVFSKYMEMAR